MDDAFMHRNSTTAQSFDAEDFARQVRDWVNSPTTIDKIRATQRSIRTAAEEAEKASSIDQVLLQKRVTL